MRRFKMTVKRHCLSVIPSAPTPLPIIRQSSTSSTSSISLMRAAMKFAILLYGTKKNMPGKIKLIVSLMLTSMFSNIQYLVVVVAVFVFVVLDLDLVRRFSRSSGISRRGRMSSQSLGLALHICFMFRLFCCRSQRLYPAFSIALTLSSTGMPLTNKDL